MSNEPTETPFDVLGLRSARYADPGETIIELEVQFRALGWVPFAASASDPEAHGRAIHARCLAGDAGTIAAYEAPA